MIIGDNFVWLHFPKCAGTFTEKLIRKYFNSDPRIYFDPIDPKNVIWHQNLAQREKKSNIDFSDKAVICNFRRLPFWIISRIRYEEMRSGKTVPRKLIIEGRFYNENGTESKADKTLQKFTERKVDHWLRTEHLEVDFMNVFSKYLNVRPLISSADFTEMVNSTGKGSNIEGWFNRDELINLYRSNPSWSMLELELYGDLLLP